MTERKQMNAAWRVPYLRLMSRTTRQLYIQDLLHSAYDSELSIQHAVEVIDQLAKHEDVGPVNTAYEFREECWQFNN